MATDYEGSMSILMIEVENPGDKPSVYWRCEWGDAISRHKWGGRWDAVKVARVDLWLHINKVHDGQMFPPPKKRGKLKIAYPYPPLLGSKHYREPKKKIRRIKRGSRA
jgi:hypothetical protein